MTRTPQTGPTNSTRREIEPTETEHQHSIAVEDAPGGPHREWILVVLDPDDPRRTVRAAMRDPAVVSGAVDLLLVFPTSEYEERRQARREAGVTAPYSLDQFEEEIRHIAHGIGREFLDSSGRNYMVLTGVGRTRDFGRKALGTREYARVYFATPRRRLWRRLFRRSTVPAWLADALPDSATVVWVTGGVVSPDVPRPEDVSDATVRSTR